MPQLMKLIIALVISIGLTSVLASPMAVEQRAADDSCTCNPGVNGQWCGFQVFKLASNCNWNNVYYCAGGGNPT